MDSLAVKKVIPYLAYSRDRYWNVQLEFIFYSYIWYLSSLSSVPLINLWWNFMTSWAPAAPARDYYLMPMPVNCAMCHSLDVVTLVSRVTEKRHQIEANTLQPFQPLLGWQGEKGGAAVMKESLCSYSMNTEVSRRGVLVSAIDANGIRLTCQNASCRG